jgi:subtilisin family serine protease
VPLLTDPLFSHQFHHDMIHTPDAWQITRGKGAIVSIVDDGCQSKHPELSFQYISRLSRNLNLNSGSRNENDPEPDMSHEDFHGTACCGVATGHNNTYCGVGAAYEAGLAGVRLISEATDDATEAEGITIGMDEVSVFSCSWGPVDDGKRLEAPGRVTKMAMENAAAKGRSNRGSIWMVNCVVYRMLLCEDY